MEDAFETAHAYIARTRAVPRRGIDWAEVRRNLPPSATTPFLPANAWPKGPPPPLTRTKRRPTSAAWILQGPSPSQAEAHRPLTFDERERLRESQHFFSLDKNTGFVSTSQSIVSARGVETRVRTQPSLEVRALRKASLLPANERSRLPAPIRAKLPVYSTLRSTCFMHGEHDPACFLCVERRLICNQASKEAGQPLSTPYVSPTR